MTDEVIDTKPSPDPTGPGLWEHPAVLDALAGHCCATHFTAEDVRQCDYCRQLMHAIECAIDAQLGRPHD